MDLPDLKVAASNSFGLAPGLVGSACTVTSWSMDPWPSMPYRG